MTITIEQRKAYSALRPVIERILETELDQEMYWNNHGYPTAAFAIQRGQTMSGRIALLDGELLDLLDEKIGLPEPEPPKKAPGLPFKRK